MNVKGTHTFKIPPAELWNYLMNPQVLAEITPGDTNLTTLAEDQYEAVSNIKIGPVKGTFEGALSVEDKVAPESFVINMKQKSKIGNAQGKINMQLQEMEAGSTQLSFDGKVKLSGMIARTGQRVLSGVANALSQEVFTALDAYIENNKTVADTGASVKASKVSIWSIILAFFRNLFKKN